MDGKGNSLERPFQYIGQGMKIAMLGLIVFGFFFTLNQIKLSQLFPIKTVRIYGLAHADPKEAEGLISPALLRGFFSVNVEFIRDRLMQLPWVADISVSRRWPDQINIAVIERKAVAVWNQGSLLSDTGDLFAPPITTYPEHLPTFKGPSGKQIMMLQYFNAMNRILMPLHATISTLEMTPYATWKLALSNGVALQIGHKEILTRLRHFVKVYPKAIGEHVADVEYVDLRYSNGMAVRWKTPVMA